MSIEPGKLEQLEHAMLDLVSDGTIPIPPYPGVALRVQRAAERRDVGLAQVATLVGSDSALAADVLRCANSAVYRRGEPITTLTQAVTRVGSEQVIRLVLASALAGHVQSAGPLALIRRIVWIEELASAAICQNLAHTRGLVGEEAFVAGLLHDFGKVVAVSTLEAMYAERRIGRSWELSDLLQAIERAHVPFGIAVAQRWGLPPNVTEAIGAHHNEPRAGEEPHSLREIIRISDQVVGLLTSQCQVSTTDLVRVRGLTMEEREAVSRVIEHVPELVSALERPEGRIETSSDLLAPQKTTLDDARTIEFGVTVRIDGRDRDYRAYAIASNGLALRGREPLPASRLVEATLHGPPEALRVWAITRLSRPLRDDYVVEIQPIALKGTERVFWGHLLSDA